MGGGSNKVESRCRRFDPEHLIDNNEIGGTIHCQAACPHRQREAWEVVVVDVAEEPKSRKETRGGGARVK